MDLRCSMGLLGKENINLQLGVFNMEARAKQDEEQIMLLKCYLKKVLSLDTYAELEAALRVEGTIGRMAERESKNQPVVQGPIFVLAGEVAVGATPRLEEQREGGSEPVGGRMFCRDQLRSACLLLFWPKRGFRCDPLCRR